MEGVLGHAMLVLVGMELFGQLPIVMHRLVFGHHAPTNLVIKYVRIGGHLHSCFQHVARGGHKLVNEVDLVGRGRATITISQVIDCSAFGLGVYLLLYLCEFR